LCDVAGRNSRLVRRWGVSIAVGHSPEDPAGHEGAVVKALQRPVRARLAGFDDVYAAHYRDVFRYALGLTRSLEEAEEVTADTFERALRGWSTVPDRPIAWLLVTARHLATDRWRRARRLGRVLLATRRSSATAEQLTPEAEFRAWFESLAAVLTARQREVLVLRYQRDLADVDIGLIMGLSESGVRSLIARALAVLRTHPELL
jgi:RNA polymerase sigma-70 factor, ECF subfamily